MIIIIQRITHLNIILKSDHLIIAISNPPIHIIEEQVQHRDIILGKHLRYSHRKILSNITYHKASRRSVIPDQLGKKTN